MSNELRSAWGGLRWWRLGGCLWAVACVLGGAEGVSTRSPATGPAVGVLSDYGRLVFEGLKTFSSNQVLQGLLSDPDFLVASQPLAPRAAYLEAVREKVTLAYQHAGFADVGVQVTLDETEERAAVRVEEGERFKAGPVRVTGARTVSTNWLLSQLVGTKAEAERKVALGRLSGRQEGSGKGSGRRASVGTERAMVNAWVSYDQPFLNSAGALVRAEEPLWVLDEPAVFDALGLQQAREAVLTLLQAAGYGSAAVEVQVRPHRGQGLAELVIEILEEGPRSRVGKIRVSGHKQNREKDVLSYLKLEPGAIWEADQVHRLERMLWDSARFRSYRVLPTPSASRTGEIDLEIELTEYQGVPRLGKALSAEQRVWLKVREWLLGRLGGAEDLVMSARLEVPGFAGEQSLDFVFSGQGLLWLWGSADGTGTMRHHFGLVVSTNEFGLYLPQAGLQFVSGAPSVGLDVFLHVKPNDDLDSENENHLSVGAGYRSHLSQESRPIGLDLVLAPASFVDSQGNLPLRKGRGNRYVHRDDTTLLEVDGESGRVIRAEGQLERGRWVGHFEAGGFDRMRGGLQESSRGQTNHYRAGLPLSTLTTFLAQAGSVLATNRWAREWAGWTEPQMVAVLGMLDQVIAQPVLVPLDGYLSRLSERATEEVFHVPLDAPGTAEGWVIQLRRMTAAAVFRYCRETFPGSSWPVAMSRDFVLLFSGKMDDGRLDLERLVAVGDVGPVGCLVGAYLLQGSEPGLSERFATAGLKRLNSEAWGKEGRLLLGGDHVLAQSARRAIGALGRWPEDQVERVASLVGGTMGSSFYRAWVEVKPVLAGEWSEVLPRVLEQLWQGGMQESVRSALSGLTASTQRGAEAQRLFEEAMRLYAADEAVVTRARVAGLFEEAAGMGHPGAQFFLGQCYEEGHGVKKDLGRAMAWYRRSARGGMVDAQVALANIYSDGVSVPVDLVEACTWLTLASGQGHQPSTISLRMFRRRLNAEQEEALKRRLEAETAGKEGVER